MDSRVQSDNILSPGYGIGALPWGSYEILEKAVHTMLASIWEKQKELKSTEIAISKGQVYRTPEGLVYWSELLDVMIPTCYKEVCEGLNALDANAKWLDTSQKFFHNGLSDTKGRRLPNNGKRLDSFLYEKYKLILFAKREQILDCFQDLIKSGHPQSANNVGGASLRSTGVSSQPVSGQSSLLPADSTAASAAIETPFSHTSYSAPKVIPRYDERSWHGERDRRRKIQELYNSPYTATEIGRRTVKTNYDSQPMPDEFAQWLNEQTLDDVFWEDPDFWANIDLSDIFLDRSNAMTL